MDQTADKIALGYRWEGLRFGIVLDRNRVTNRATDVTQKRDAFAIPVTYNTGANTFSLTYGQARSLRVNDVTADDTGTQMLSLSYMYALSKRTSLGLSYAEMRNQRNGRYNFWLGGIGGMQLAAADAGSNPRMFYAGIKHVF